MAQKYRYRDGRGCTRDSLERRKHLVKIGQVVEIQGKRWQGKYRHTEGVLVKGTNGSCRFGGYCWGYSGEGPRGLVELLVGLGVKRGLAEGVAFHAPRHDQDGIDWRIRLTGGDVACEIVIYNEHPANVRVRSVA